MAVIVMITVVVVAVIVAVLVTLMVVMSVVRGRRARALHHERTGEEHDGCARATRADESMTFHLASPPCRAGMYPAGGPPKPRVDQKAVAVVAASHAATRSQSS